MPQTFFKDVCFTSYSSDEPTWNAAVMSYLVYGKEQCPETSRQHWQGYVELRKRHSTRQLQRLLGNHHFERRNGTPAEAATYCKKDGDWKEFGELKSFEPGKRTDLESIGQSILAGQSVDAVAIETPGKFIQYGRGFAQLERVALKKRQRQFRPVHVEIWWGETGVGKTRAWFDRFGKDGYRFQYSKNNDWWDGYSGEKHILFDEFSSQVSLSNMLMYLDVYPMRMEVKGGHTYADWDTVHILSNDNPQSFYSGSGVSQEKRKAFARRIGAVIEMRKNCTVYTWSFAFSNVVEFVTNDLN